MNKKEIIQQLNNKIISPNYVVIFGDMDGEVILRHQVELSESGGVLYVPDIDNSYLLRKSPECLLEFLSKKITVYKPLITDEWLQGSEND